MRLVGLMFCILLFAGCGGGLRDQVVGSWHVDPTSIETPRLKEGAKATEDWTDATALMAKVKVLLTESGSASAQGFDLASSGTWQLKGYSILVNTKDEPWPTMIYDPKTKRIHLSIVKGEDQLKMDLIKD